MNVPMTWLLEYANVNCDTNTFIDKMTMSGSKVEEIIKFGEGVSNIVVGNVLSIEKHPSADKLVITKIEVGNGEILQIVTGAKNLKEGDFVPVALNGSKVFGGKVIKKGSLRGEESNGMLCSIGELGYTAVDYPECSEEGIYVFEKPQPLGADALEILQIKEDVVSYEITSNRPDCFSVLGIAREAAATFKVPFVAPIISLKEEGEGDIDKLVSVEIKNEKLCPRYIARVVKDVKIGPSPQWLRHRLSTAGIRPINNIVDITNYVMLEYGQPMHAFDITEIEKEDGLHKIIVRNAEQDEEFTTLDGVKRKLDENMLVIADCKKAIALAGVMGGENSKVTLSDNATILFESANFNGVNVRTTAKKVGLRTDASAKFEKGLDPNLALAAVNRAVQLVEILECGNVVKNLVDNYPKKRENTKVSFSIENINKLLGLNLSYDEVCALLTPLEIYVENSVADIPTFRPDITIEADLIEEIARFYGYDNLPETLTTGTPTVGKKNTSQIIEDIIKNTMVSFGFYEALNYAFESPKVFDKLKIDENSDLRKAITIKNPLGEDYSIMRTTTLNYMLTSLSTNYNRRNKEAYLFELSKVYMPKSLPLNERPIEPEILTLGFYSENDFFYLKGVIEGLLDTLGIDHVHFESLKDLPYMHPGRTAKVFHNKEGQFGFLGEIHPSIAKAYDIDTKVYVASIEVSFLKKHAKLSKTFAPLPKYPSIVRDIAMIVDVSVPVASIEKSISEKGGAMLKKIQLFDVYTGKQIEEGKKSVAYSLTFRADDKTLTDEEISKPLNKILTNLESKIGAKLRDK